MVGSSRHARKEPLQTFRILMFQFWEGLHVLLKKAGHEVCILPPREDSSEVRDGVFPKAPIEMIKLAANFITTVHNLKWKTGGMMITLFVLLVVGS